MGQDTAVVAVALLAGLTVIALVVYALLWRWLRGAPERSRWLGMWVVAHGLSPLTALYLKYLTPLGASPALSVPAAGRQPLLAGLMLVALLLAGVYLWASLLALLDGLRQVIAPSRSRRLDEAGIVEVG